jgi:signal transduction histidine kinase
MDTDCIASFLRHEQATIAVLWEREVRADQPAIAPSRPVLSDHLAQVLDGLADYIDGNVDRAEEAFGALVEGPALARLGYGVGLETLTREYSKLRMVLMKRLLMLGITEPRDSILAMHEGMDRAMSEAMTRYAARREEVRERFITILGHDLRDPLATAIISANGLAANPRIDKEHRMVASRISRACSRMQRMINDVLDFARGHLGSGIPAHPVPADMGDIIRAATDEAIGANPQRKITCDIHGDLHGIFDRDRVHQAITNLIANAVHHTHDSIEIIAHEAEDHHAVITEVISHGSPIPDDIRRRIFDPFASFADDGPSRRHGLGLGLYIVQQIALAHGGTCNVDVRPDANAFVITWPRQRVAAVTAA